MNVLTLLSFLLAALALTSSSAHSTDYYRNQGPCELGFRDGRRMVKNEWDRSFERNCDYIWDLEEDANRAADRAYRRGRNWREREFNRCARLGVKDAVRKYEKKCLDDTSDQCFDLAQAAAEAIVLDFGCVPPDLAKAPGTPVDYKENCRTLAKNNCPGRIWTVIDNWCPENNGMKTENRLKLERKCGPTVDSFIYV